MTAEISRDPWATLDEILGVGPVAAVDEGIGAIAFYGRCLTEDNQDPGDQADAAADADTASSPDSVPASPATTRPRRVMPCRLPTVSGRTAVVRALGRMAYLVFGRRGQTT